MQWLQHPRRKEERKKLQLLIERSVVNFFPPTLDSCSKCSHNQAFLLFDHIVQLVALVWMGTMWSPRLSNSGVGGGGDDGGGGVTVDCIDVGYGFLMLVMALLVVLMLMIVF